MYIHFKVSVIFLSQQQFVGCRNKTSKWNAGSENNKILGAPNIECSIFFANLHQVKLLQLKLYLTQNDKESFNIIFAAASLFIRWAERRQEKKRKKQNVIFWLRRRIKITLMMMRMMIVESVRWMVRVRRNCKLTTST